MSILPRARHWLASRLLDAPRYRWTLRTWPLPKDPVAAPWVGLHNRGERLVRTSGQRGVRCEWRWTSALFFPLGRPKVGQRLLRRVLQDWPLELPTEPTWRSGEPEVSFILGHRGEERWSHLNTTLASLAAQRDVSAEVVLVEQDHVPRVAPRLPPWVRYLHTPPPDPGMPYARSWAFNCGARIARGRLLVFHDNDICAPRDYAAEILRTMRAGFEAARLHRFVFYLTPDTSRSLMAGEIAPPDAIPAEIVQNCEGHSVAVERDTYFELGGHDESFIGWGGEDNEFFDRLRTRRLHDHAYLPFLHLHHDPQPEKSGTRRPAAPFTALALPAKQRIARLKSRPMGAPRSPWSEGSGGHGAV